mmetsp:Transcript_18844/g.36978  ORF Transcript_18844/g.36978 Transcript_18844/m.36978 type:complete len:510 (+) Transcript_18844:157-1686(+)|eukprot:CAMPEP_0171493718 /NCGR_PEP_ID=MMETSP0958-20121227/5118_1 /TAXON_ID=87120 /ORGANISM="Aurantiochytrium limacinum, Strain ATCCMYA-1381" /LENGTH=509 /DNA_ID=CAMNT_0012027373 /DNA_START=12 /DNA_END=1541 /DNA_ORIENTATION=-
MAEQLQSMTGMSTEEAQNFLEMAGGDMETAINLYFSMMGGDGGMSSGATGSNTTPSGPDYLNDFELRQILWSESPADAWKDQTLDWYQDGIGISQVKNGPCGILAVLQGVVVAQRLQRGEPVMGKSVSDDEYAHVIATILELCATTVGKNEVVVCYWRHGRKHDGMDTTHAKLGEVESTIIEHIADYCTAGFLEVLLCSCILSHGIDQVRQDVLSYGGELPLVVGPHQLCTSELLMLLLTGRAAGGVGAYAPFGGEKVSIDVPTGIGLLSFSELETGIPVNDRLKTPAQPVWVLHSGDHFTLLFSDEQLDQYKPPLQLWHFNGLPPAGPRMAQIEIYGEKEAENAPRVHQESYFKPAVGEIEDIVQANESDKKAHPEDWKRWRFESILAIDDPSVKGPPRPSSMPPPVTFVLDPSNAPGPKDPWRCASCYRTRFETMCFGQNEAGTTTCQYCGQKREDGGYSLWLSFEDLPVDWQRKMNRRYAPKIVPLLQTKWPDCTVECKDGKIPTA